MYAIYGNIYPQYTPNVSIYTIHGSYGLYKPSRTLRREVCCENCLVYKKQGHPDVVCAIPRRLEMAQEKGLLKLGAGEASKNEESKVSG